MFSIGKLATSFAVSGLIVAGCGDGPATSVQAGANSDIAFDEYKRLDLGLESTLSPAIAVGGDLLFAFGGIQRSGEGWTSVPSGSLHDLATGATTQVAPWPSGRAPYSPAVVWSGEEFIVIGAECESVTPAEDELDCGEPVQAAAFAPKTMAWRALDGFEASLLTQPGPFAFAYGFSQGKALFAVGGAESELVGVDPDDGRATVYGPIPPSEEASTCFAGERLSRVRVDTARDVLESSRLDVESGVFEPVSDTSLGAGEGTAPDFVDCPGAPVLYSATDGVGLTRWLTPDAATWTELPRLDLSEVSCCPEVVRVDDRLVVWPGDGSPASVLLNGDERWQSVSSPAVEPVQLLATPSALVVVSRTGEPRSGTEIGVVPIG